MCLFIATHSGSAPPCSPPSREEAGLVLCRTVSCIPPDASTPAASVLRECQLLVQSQTNASLSPENCADQKCLPGASQVLSSYFRPRHGGSERLSHWSRELSQGEMVAAEAPAGLGEGSPWVLQTDRPGPDPSSTPVQRGQCPHHRPPET